MARLIWAVLCEKVLQDKDSNLLSMINVVEKITIHGLESDIAAVPKPPEKILAGPIALSLVMWWEREDNDDSQVRIAIRAPKGEVVDRQVLRVDLNKSKTFRVIVRYEALAVGFGAGEYRFEIQTSREPEGSDDKWTALAVIPLELVFDPGPKPVSSST